MYDLNNLIKKIFFSILILTIYPYNAFATTNNCVSFECTINLNEAVNNIFIKGNINNININSNISTSETNITNKIVILELSQIKNINLIDNNHNSNFILTISPNTLAVINDVNAPDLTIDISKNDLNFITIKKVLIKNFKFTPFSADSGSPLVVLNSNTNYKVLNQDANFFPTNLNLLATNIEIDFYFDDKTTSSKEYEIQLSESTGLNSISLNNINTTDVILKSFTNRLYLNKLEISYNTSNIGNIRFTEINDITINNLNIAHGNFIASSATIIKGDNIFIDNLTTMNTTPLTIFFNFNKNVWINKTDQNLNYVGKTGSLTLGNKDTYNIYDSTNNSSANVFNNVIFASTDLKITGNTMIKSLALQNSKETTLTIQDGLFNLENTAELNIKELNIKDGYFAASNIDSIKAEKINLSNASKLVANKLQSNSVNIMLTEYNKNEFAIEVDNVITNINTTWAINFDTAYISNISQINTYHLLKESSYDKDINIIYLNNREWLSLSSVESATELNVAIIRTKNYSDTIKALTPSIFAESFALAIDEEMKANALKNTSMNNDFVNLIRNLDSSRDSVMLNQNIESMKPIDKEVFLNSISTNDYYALNIMEKNITNLNKPIFWLDTSIISANHFDDTKSNGFALNMGGKFEFIKDNSISFGFYNSINNLSNNNNSGDINSFGLISSYAYTSASFYLTASVLKSFNTTNINRTDNFNYTANSSPVFDSTLFGFMVGKNIYTKNDFTIINNGSISLNNINNDKYNENGTSSYSYEDTQYQVIQAGYTVGIGKISLVNGLAWEVKSLIGYKGNSQNGSENLNLKFSDSVFSVKDNLAEQSGFLIRPDLSLQYVADRIALDLGYVLEYMPNGYQDNRIRIIIKYKNL